MKSNPKVLLLAVCALTFSACEEKIENKSESGSYSYDINGCKTGEQSYGSRAELCKKLRSDAGNHGCAEDFRRKQFAQACSGQDFDAPEPVTTPPATTTAGSDASGSSSSSSSSSMSGTYRYQLDECDTGTQTFNSQSELCSELQDETLNKGCAQAQRTEAYNQACTGNTGGSAPGPDAGFPGFGSPDEPSTPPGFGSTDSGAPAGTPTADQGRACQELMTGARTPEELCARLKDPSNTPSCPKEFRDPVIAQVCHSSESS